MNLFSKNSAACRLFLCFFGAGLGQLLTIDSLYTQTPVIQWQKTIGGVLGDEVRSVRQTSDGGYVIGGSSYSYISGDKTENSKGDWDYWVVKINATGSIVWQKTIGGNNLEKLQSILQTSDGGYIMGGYSQSSASGDKSENSLGGMDYWVVKLDASGNIVWENTIGGSGHDELYSIKLTNDGGYMLGGHSASDISGDKTENSKGSYDYWIVKLNGSGSVVWQKTIGGGAFDELWRIEPISGGGWFLAGSSGSGISGDKTENASGWDYWLVVIDDAGTVVAQNTIGGSGTDFIREAALTADGGFIIAGYSNSGISGDKSESNKGDNDYWVIKLNSALAIEWQKTLGGSNNDALYSVLQANDGGYLVGGLSFSGISGNKTEINKGYNDYWVLKLTNTGSIAWQKTIGGNSADELYSMMQANDGDYLLGGTSLSNTSGDKTEDNRGDYDFWVLKLGLLLPEIDVKGNSISITDGDALPSTADNTNFGSALVSSGSNSRNFAVHNTGAADLILAAGSITISGAHASDFSLSGISLPVTITAGNSITFNVVFDPTATGLRTASVNIANNDNDENFYEFAIEGTGFNNIYTVGGSGDWTVSGNWSPSFPGLAIAAGDQVIINTGANCTIPNGTTVVNNGTLTVNGTITKVAGSTLTNSATGTVAIAAGGALNNDAGTFTNAGTLTTAAGGTFSNSSGSFTNSGTWTHSGSHTSTYGSFGNSGAITNYGTINAGQYINMSNTGTWTNEAAGSMTINALTNAAGATLTNNGTMNVGVANSGTFVNNLTFTAGYVTQSNAAGATWTNSATGTMTLSCNPFVNSGTFNNAGTFTQTNCSGLGSFSNSGTIALTGPMTVGSSIPGTNTGTININAGGSLLLSAGAGTDFTNNGTINFNGGTFTNNATYKGSGTFAGNVFNNTGGIVAPGASPGCLIFSAGYTNGTGTQQIEIGGTTPCTQHDQIQVTGGAATLSGTLTISLFGGYVPAVTESYTILTAPGGVSGTFTTVNYPSLCGITWSIAYNATDVVVTATIAAQPEADVQGNATSIADGDNMPATADHTDFGTVATGSNLVRTFTVRNTGTAALTVSGIASNNGLFTVGALTPASPILAGQSATFTVTFAPNAVGVQNATVTVTNNDCDEALYDFAVTGKGATPAAALSFDGTDDYVSLPGTFGGPTWTELTIEAWVKVAATSGDFQAIVSATDLAFAHLQLFNVGNNVAFTNTGGVIFPIVPQTPTGQWRHVAMVVKSGDSRLYVDGVQQGPAVTTTFGNILASSSVSIGRGASGSRFLNGQLDEVRIWNTARTCDQINQLRNCELTGSEPGLVAYYKFNQGFDNENNSGVTTLTDAAGGDNNGTLSNFTLDGTISNWVTPGGVTTGTSCPAVTAPEANVQGGLPLVTIADGDATPSTTDHTDFDVVATGSNRVRTFTILNTGSTSLTVSNIASNNGLFTVGALTPASPIPAGQSATFTVTFAPNAVGVQTATITVTNNDCDEATYDFAVSGTGALPGAALTFDGSNDFVDVAYNLNQSSLTLEAWVKPTSNARMYVICNDNDGNYGAGFAVNNYQLEIDCHNTFINVPGTLFSNGTWAHVAVVYQSDARVRAYVNGTEVYNAVPNASWTASMNGMVNFSLGRHNPFNTLYYKGGIDEVRVWSRSLCQPEIQAQRNCELTGSEPGLAVYYKFNQGIADNGNAGLTTLNDLAGTAQNGTLTNFTLSGSASNWTAPGGVTSGNSCTPYQAPEIDVQGGTPLISIADGDLTPATADATDFGTIAVNTSLAHNFTIYNTSSVVLTITGISSDNARFAVSGAPSFVAANSSATFTVTFNPLATGTQNAKITVSNDDCDEATYDFAVKGTGATPASALHFDGMNDNVSIPDHAALQLDQFTLETWFNPSTAADFPALPPALIAKGAAGNPDYFLVPMFNTRKIAAGFYTGSTFVSTISTTDLAQNTWYHLAATFDGTNLKIYVNGVLENTTDAGGLHPRVTANALVLGLTNTTQYVNGALDEVRIWNIARSCEEIRQLRNCELTGSEGGLVAYYKFNQGFANENNGGVTTLTDAATALGGANNGTLNGFTLSGLASNWVTPGGVTSGNSCTPYQAPEIDVQGGTPLISIADGDLTPATADATDFGTIAVNASLAHNFTIYNTGSVVLTITGISSDNARFAVSGAPSFVAANSSATFTVTFNPLATGTQNAKITVSNDDCDEATYDFAVTGTGQCVPPSFSACPANQSVNVVPMTCAAPVTYTATATGTPTPALTYTFTGATTGSGSGTGSGASFNKGVTNVVVTATNFCGAPTCSFTVTVTDNEPPAITCAGPVTINTTAGLCTGTTTLTAPTVSDNCSSVMGNTLHFDGTNDYVGLGNITQVNGVPAITLEAWMYPTNTSNGVIVSKGAVTSQNAINIERNGQTVYFRVCGNSDSYGYVNNVLPVNTWTHIACVFDGTLTGDANRLKIYVNGVQQTLTFFGATIPSLTPSTATPLTLGAFNGGTLAFGGALDEVRIWNTARTQSQIQANMNVGISAQSGLVALYHFNQGTAYGNNAGLTTAADNSGSNYTGTLNNFALTGAASNWGAFSPTLSNNAPATYPKGITTVTWTAKDDSGNSNTCQQTVTVTDNQAPTLASPGNQTLNAVANTCANTYTIADPVSDYCPGATWGYTLTGATTGSATGIADGTGSGPLSFNLGVTTVTLSGTDGTNSATPVSFTVTVNGTPPSVTCPADQTVSLCGGAVPLSGESPAGGTFSGTGVSAGSFNPATAGAGSHLITYTYEFAANCSNSCAFSIRVTSPEIEVRGLGQSIADGDNTPAAPDDTDFGGVLTGNPATHTFTIVNSDPALALNLTGSPKVDISGSPAFTVGTQPATPVAAANGTSTFTIAFNPSSAGLHTATVSIASNDCDENPYTFAVRGRGAVPPSITVKGNGTVIANRSLTASMADDTDFGSASVSGGTVTRTFTVENIPDGLDLVLNGMPKVEVADRDASDFTVTMLPGSPVAGGGSVSFEVTFDPSAAGLRTAILILTHNDLPQNPFVFTVHGTGL